MEGGPTPYFGYFSKEYYSKIVRAFQTIGDVNDAEILLKAGHIDSFYSKILDEKDGVYTVSAEVFGEGINVWLRSQGENVEVVE